MAERRRRCGGWSAALVLVFLLMMAKAQAATPQDFTRFLDTGGVIRIGLVDGVDSLKVQTTGRFEVVAAESSVLGEVSGERSLELSIVRESGARPQVAVHRLQVQAAREQVKAEQTARELQAEFEYPVHVVFAEPWYKVQVGDFATRQEAAVAQEHMRQKGYTDTWFTTHQRAAKGAAQLVVRGMEGLPTGLTELHLRPRNGHSRFLVNGRPYRGELRLFVNSQLKLAAVNALPLNQYLYGVVAAEMGNAGAQRLEALKAQAVAARSYALNHLGDYQEKGFDLLSTVMSQAYYGSERETDAIRYAVDSTEGEVLVFGGEIIGAPFHSNAGGHTAFPEEVWEGTIPYLRGTQEVDPVSRQTLDAEYNTYEWEVTYTENQLRQILQAQGAEGESIDAEISARGPSGRVTEMALTIGGSVRVARKDKIRQVLSWNGKILPSTKFVLDKKYRNGRLVTLTLRGWGSGHGLGLSQAGAMALADRGWSYRQILTRYYCYARVIDLERYRSYAREENRLASVGLMKEKWDGWVFAEGLTDTVTQIAYSPDGARLAWVQPSQGIWLWHQGKPSHIVSAFVTEIEWISPTRLVYAAQSDAGAEAVEVDLETGSKSALGKGRAIHALSYSPGQEMLYAQKDGMVQVYLFRQRVWLPLLTDASYPSISPDGGHLAFIRQGKVWIYDTRTGQSVGITGDVPATGPVTWDPQGLYLAVQGDETVTVYDVSNYREVYSAKGDTFAWSASGRYLGYVRSAGPLGNADVFVVTPGQWYEFNLTHTDGAGEKLLAWHPSDRMVALYSEALELLSEGEGSPPTPVLWQVRLSTGAGE